MYYKTIEQAVADIATAEGRCNELEAGIRRIVFALVTGSGRLDDRRWVIERLQELLGIPVTTEESE